MSRSLVLILAACTRSTSPDAYEGDRRSECRNGVDDDGDGSIDCADAGCFRAIACGGEGTGLVPPQPTVTTDDTTPSGNQPPVADAGGPLTGVFPGDVVRLDATGSTDPEGEALTYRWTVGSSPSRSEAVLQRPTDPRALLVVDTVGVYRVELRVSDGVAEDVDVLDIQVLDANQPPRARTTASREVDVGQTITLDGSGSFDLDGDDLTGTWRLLAQPTGSTAVLEDVSGTGGLVATLTPDAVGAFRIEFVVSDGQLSSQPVGITITGVAPP